VLPRTHGSALFTRGETQALVVTTLGTGEDEQIIDALESEYREHFLLHYNFPPYSVGEAGRLGSPGRREVGHGKLAWRAVRPLLPEKESFPYTIRIVSEITESNGSSSMATVCGTSLSLMDAGVPVAKAIAGIAMGLIKEERGVAVLSDILGDEDHLGDMDFKVAGTRDGVTALQMDIKITSITEEIMRQALAQARDGRMHILGEMAKARQDVHAALKSGRLGPKEAEFARQVAARLGGRRPAFGCYFDCAGRGRGLFDVPDHDVTLIREALGEFPFIGFFGNGEFAPIGRRNFFHNYTGALVLFPGEPGESAGSLGATSSA